MDERYRKNTAIARIWETENKLRLWQLVELAVIDARAKHDEIDPKDSTEIRRILEATPIDIDWWKARDDEINQDLIAFVEERRRHLPNKLQRYFHGKMTSYDTEDPAFAIMLRQSVDEVERLLITFVTVLVTQIKRYRFSVMLGETHGQWAELQTFGKRIATWLMPMLINTENLRVTGSNLSYSKLSGAIGNSPDLSKEIQETALDSLGLKPFYGATQIVPRELYAHVASSLGVVIETLSKIATDIRLDARSGRTLMREPFKKTQKGSSRMPHKRNTITLEQIAGMLRLSEGYVQAIQKNVQTWQERAIEQSCVERVAWPDLFYVVTHCLKRMTSVLEGLQVYQDEMLREVYDCRGVYAASKVADFLSEEGLKFGLTANDAYRIVQLAAFNAFQPELQTNEIRMAKFRSYEEAERACGKIITIAEKESPQVTIYKIVKNAKLKYSADLEANDEEIGLWNETLRSIFDQKNDDVCWKWDKIFSFDYNLRGETTQIDGVLSRAENIFAK